MKKFVKKFATPTVIMSSVFVFSSGLYMHFIGKSEVLEETHAHLGLLFVLGAILHGYLNWGSTKRYLKQGSTYLVLIPITLLIILSIIEASHEDDREHDHHHEESHDHD